MEFITGNKFKQYCHHSYDEQGYIVNSEPKENEILRIFVKIDYIHIFFTIKKEKPYILYTHNGDLPVDDSCLKYFDDPFLIKWYGQNVMIIHPKLKSIPIGIANEMWPHGDEKVFNEVINQNLEKQRLIYVNFDVNTNPIERNYCLKHLAKNNLHIQPKLPFKKYLEEVAKSYFVVSPNGNGVDCHKTWESLYLESIPIVTKSINSEFYKDYPIVIIDDWSKFNPLYFTISLYREKWKNFNKALLHHKK